MWLLKIENMSHYICFILVSNEYFKLISKLYLTLSLLNYFKGLDRILLCYFQLCVSF